jgi:hypothetical protein
VKQALADSFWNHNKGGDEACLTQMCHQHKGVPWQAPAFALAHTLRDARYVDDTLERAVRRALGLLYIIQFGLGFHTRPQCKCKRVGVKWAFGLIAKTRDARMLGRLRVSCRLHLFHSLRSA